MDFGEALRIVKDGRKARRRDWAPPRGWYIELIPPVPGSSDVDWPYLAKAWSDGMVAYAPTHADLLADDWEPLPEQPPRPRREARGWLVQAGDWPGGRSKLSPPEAEKVLDRLDALEPDAWSRAQ